MIASGKTQRGGFTLVEILVVMAVIAIMLGMAVAVGNYVRTNAEIKNTKTTVAMLVTALREYERLQGANAVEWPGEPFALADQGGADPWLFSAVEQCIGSGGTGDQHEIASSKWQEFNELVLEQQNMLLASRGSIEVLYWYLSQEPDCEAILSRLADEMVTNEDNDAVTVGGETTALLEVNDAWGRPIRYRTRGEGNFPVLTSAGVDGVFDNADDIVSN